MRMTLFFLIFVILIMVFYISLPTWQFRNIITQLTIQPTISRVVINSSAENQSIVFKDESPLIRLYLDVIRDTVCGLTLRTQEQSVFGTTIPPTKTPLNLQMRIRGEDWPLIGITMVGQKRLINVEWALRLVIANGVPGDFIECGVWRGGTSIFARAVLKALDINDRHVWLADSFQGLPKPRTQNDDASWSLFDYLRVLLSLSASTSLSSSSESA